MGLGNLNLTQPTIYAINIFVFFVIYLCILFFFSLFGISKELIRDSHGLKFCNFARL